MDYLMAVTPSAVHNGMVATRLAPELGRERVFQPAPDDGRLDRRRGVSRDWRGQFLRDPAWDFASFDEKYAQAVRATRFRRPFRSLRDACPPFAE